jgi:hypothetical protein
MKGNKGINLINLPIKSVELTPLSLAVLLALDSFNIIFLLVVFLPYGAPHFNCYM